MKQKMYLLLLTLWPGLGLAQHLERTIAENYPPDISLKVISVSDAIDIDEEMQRKLAVHFADEAAAMQSSGSEEDVLEIQRQYATALEELLGEEEVHKYYQYYATKDTLTAANTTAEEQEAYFNAAFEILNQAKPLPKKDSLRSTYDQLCSYGDDEKLSSNFKLAMQSWLRDEDYFYAFFKNKIDEIAWVSAVYYSNWYKQNYGASAVATEKIMQAWREKMKAITSLQYTYEHDPEAGQMLINDVNDKCDSQVTIYLMEDGVYRSPSSFWLAVQNAAYLDLSVSQLEELKAREISWIKWRRKNSATNVSSWSYERNEYTDGMLTDGQFNKLLVLKNSYAAFEKGKETWAALKDKNLTWQSDSATVVNHVGGYYTTLFVTLDFFENDPAMQESHMNAVYALKPEPLKRLENEGKPSGEEEPYRGTFLW